MTHVNPRLKVLRFAQDDWAVQGLARQISLYARNTNKRTSYDFELARNLTFYLTSPCHPEHCEGPDFAQRRSN
jgi:hypothetical protein